MQDNNRFNRGRRRFIQSSTALGACFMAGIDFTKLGPSMERSTVYFVKPATRAEGVQTLLRMFGETKWKNAISGNNVILKPNFNSAHEFPGSTHPDTLEAMLVSIKSAGAGNITILDRSGMGDTEKVMRDVDAFNLGGKYDATVTPWEKLEADAFVHTPMHGSHWSRGVEWPKQLAEADCIVQTCCLKTHQFGGHFTLSLKNSVGMVAKFAASDQYNYMRELHTSVHQRRMIAEINALYRPTLVVLDGMSCFVDGGPHLGTRKEPGVMLASTDRVALDAVGVAILRSYGTTSEVSAGRIFQQEQIARAAELGIGAASADVIDIVTPDAASEAAAEPYRMLLRKEG